MKDSPYRIGAQWEAAEAYYEIAKAAALPDVKRVAAAHRASLAPVDRGWLKKRLSQMMLAFGHERDPDRAAAWLAETGRLLLDLPGDILATAIDQAIMGSERGFIPAVGQIRAIADPLVAQRERDTRRLEALAGMVDAGGPPRARPWENVDTFDPATRCSPGDAREILAKFGLADVPKPDVPRGPSRTPTAAEIASIATQLGLGVKPPTTGQMPVPDVTGLSVSEIIEQGERLRAAWLAGIHPAQQPEQEMPEPHDQGDRRRAAR